MSPSVFRDLTIGGAVVLVGVSLLAFAFLGDEESFRAPRWVVAAVALSFMLSGGLPLRHALSEGGILPKNTYVDLALGTVLALFALLTAWIMVAVGPEGVSLDVPITLPAQIEGWVKGLVFYAVTGVAAALCGVYALSAFAKALPALGRSAIVAVIAPALGVLAWVAIEFYRKATPPEAPIMFLSFDRRFPGDDYLVRAHGDEVLPRAGKQGSGLWVGGSGDWVEIEAPRGFDTRHGLTLEFWMKRENWVNPYTKGARSQTVATIDVEREYRGHPEIRQVSFSMELSVPRERASDKNLRADYYIYRPTARVGDVRLAPVAPVKIAADRWTHVAVVYDRFLVDRMRLYVNGVLIARALPFGSAPGFADIRTLRLGTWYERNGAYRGMIDELKVYARTLSDEEIVAAASR
jgi:hypothetical protein